MPRMRAASAAALRALSTPTQATGTPGGICAMARRASRPSSTDVDERSGTPITGSWVCAATTPESASANGDGLAADVAAVAAAGEVDVLRPGVGALACVLERRAERCDVEDTAAV